MEVKSPCKFICKYEDKYCVGCNRTMDEIVNWSTYTNEEKLKVLENISIRKSNNNYYGDFP